MRIYYHLSPYISHRKAGQDYIACLRGLGHEVLEALPPTPPSLPPNHPPTLLPTLPPTLLPGASHAVPPGRQAAQWADLAILHDEPTSYASILQNAPALGPIPKLAYCVWETDILPAAFADGLALVDGVWTCSEHSRKALQARFPAARVLPHVVKRLKPARADLDFMRQRLQAGPEKYFFYTICDSINPRKNLAALLRVFCSLFPRLDRNVHLVVKQYRQELDLSSLPNVISLPEMLHDGQIAALHALGHCFVSAHRAEAWGLSLSDAMSLGKPVIATGYSGNMQFMRRDNSYPVDFTLKRIAPEHTALCPLLTEEMRWAEIDENHLAALMLQEAGRPAQAEITGNAARIAQDYGPKAIQARLKELLREWEG